MKHDGAGKVLECRAAFERRDLVVAGATTVAAGAQLAGSAAMRSGAKRPSAMASMMSPASDNAPSRVSTRPRRVDRRAIDLAHGRPEGAHDVDMDAGLQPFAQPVRSKSWQRDMSAQPMLSASGIAGALAAMPSRPSASASLQPCRGCDCRSARLDGADRGMGMDEVGADHAGTDQGQATGIGPGQVVGRQSRGAGGAPGHGSRPSSGQGLAVRAGEELVAGLNGGKVAPGVVRGPPSRSWGRQALSGPRTDMSVQDGIIRNLHDSVPARGRSWWWRSGDTMSAAKPVRRATKSRWVARRAMSDADMVFKWLLSSTSRARRLESAG